MFITKKKNDAESEETFVMWKSDSVFFLMPRTVEEEATLSLKVRLYSQKDLGCLCERTLSVLFVQLIHICIYVKFSIILIEKDK